MSLGSQDLHPPVLHFSHFFQLKLFVITSGGGGGGGGGELYLKLEEIHLITLSAHTFFYNCSVKIILCPNCSLICVLYNSIKR